MKQLTKKELMKKVKALGKITKKERNDIVCALIGHSRIIETCWGYVHCGRCGNLIGDMLTSIFDSKEHVIVGHNCKICRKNYKALTWRDKLYAKDPFKKEKEIV